MSVAEDYREVLEDLKNEKLVINNLTTIASQYKANAEDIVGVVSERVKQAPPQQWLPLLYLSDSIVKNVGEPYRLLFGRVIHDMFVFVWDRSDAKTRKSLTHLRNTWEKWYPGPVLASIDAHCASGPPPKSSAPVHVNPRFDQPRPLPHQQKDDRGAMRGHGNGSTQRHHPYGRVDNPRGRDLPIDPRERPSDPRVPPPQHDQWRSNDYPSQPMVPHAHPAGPAWGQPNAPYGGYHAPTPNDSWYGAQPPAYGNQGYNQPSYGAPAPANGPPPDALVALLQSIGNVPLPPASQPLPHAGSAWPNQPQVGMPMNPTPAYGATGSYPLQAQPFPDPGTSDAACSFENLKIRDDNALRNIYSGSQCQTCARRFLTEKELEEHMDWHFDQKRKERERTARAFSRRWFITLDDWIMDAVPVDIDAATAFGSGEKEETDEAKTDKSKDVKADEVLDTCPVCNEKFEQYWDDVSEEWLYKDSMYEDDSKRSIVHQLCVRESAVPASKDDAFDGANNQEEIKGEKEEVKVETEA